jgi:hypothetical protein
MNSKKTLSGMLLLACVTPLVALAATSSALYGVNDTQPYKETISYYDHTHHISTKTKTTKYLSQVGSSKKLYADHAGQVYVKTGSSSKVTAAYDNTGAAIMLPKTMAGIADGTYGGTGAISCNCMMDTKKGPVSCCAKS